MKTTFINNGCLGVETEQITRYLSEFGLKLESWFLDDTIHLAAWFFNRVGQQYHVAIFGNPFSDKYYISIKCGCYVTKLDIRNFEPLTDFQSMYDFIKTTEKRR